MATLRRNEPVSTREPGIEIDAGLAIGRHVFQLVVEDDAGLVSAADQIIVEIQRVVIEPVNPTPIDPRLNPREPTPIDPRLNPREPTPTPIDPRIRLTEPAPTPVRPTPVRRTRRTSKKRNPT